MDEHEQLPLLANNLLNCLTVMRFPDESRIWALGGQPLEYAYTSLKMALSPFAQLSHARRAYLLLAARDVVNCLALLCSINETVLWQLGGKPLEDAYQALRAELSSISQRSATYRADSSSITCLVCNRTSYNPNDIAQLYCSNCKTYHTRVL